MGGVPQYKWEVYCWASLASRLRRQEGLAIQMGGVLPYKLEVYCRTFFEASRGWGFWNSSEMSPHPIWLDDRGAGQSQWKWMEEVPCRTSLAPLASPCFVLVFFFIGVEREGLLNYEGRAGIMSIVRWNLRPVIFSSKNKRGRERKGPSEIIQKFRLRNWSISSADFPMTPMEGTEHHFGPF